LYEEPPGLDPKSKLELSHIYGIENWVSGFILPPPHPFAYGTFFSKSGLAKVKLDITSVEVH
jgi:hypothetical protein